MKCSVTAKNCFLAVAGRHNRGWFYHKEHRLWFMRVANIEPLVKTNSYERGSYICFDPNTWETIRKVCFVQSVHLYVGKYFVMVMYYILLMQDNFVVHYDMLEKRPALPQH